MVSISIAMATYNGGAYLKEQLESLAGQTLLPAELHIGDDGSEDGTLDLLERFRETAPFPVHIHRNALNLGHNENFLRTADRCEGDWIAFCDQDDVWLPHKLSRCAEAVAKGPPDLMLVAHNTLIFFEDGSTPYLKTFWRGSHLKPRLALPPHWCCAGFTQMFRRDLVKIVPNETGRELRAGTTRDGHDTWIPMLAVAMGSVRLLGESLALYRRHGSNATNLLEREPASRWNKVVRALRPNGAIYTRDALVGAEIAELLQRIAAATKDDHACALLLDASSRVREFSTFARQRSLIYDASGLAARLRAVKRTAELGGYRKAPNPTFGRRALAKDMVQAIIGAIV